MGYSEQFRTRIVSKLVGPDALSANALSGEVGISQSTLSRWLREAGTVPVMRKNNTPQRQGAGENGGVACAPKKGQEIWGAKATTRDRRTLDHHRAARHRGEDRCVLVETCMLLGLSVRTVQRWRAQGPQGFDARFGPKTSPGNKLSAAERRRGLAVANEPGHLDLSPKQLVPRLADEGR